ncbi:unnamed protein product [Arabis nemorensis]|uniref:Uncharacterized protein n=1 Tax=Arabis nemorensis TaxID=586526 RepID=A0A565ARI9_9BRAS|nr:unnamed protein product [Arabis nemorensis]
MKASNPEETMYQFEINAGGSCWKLSESTITCRSSNLMTERARVIIPINFPQELSLKILLAAADNKLTLISATKEAIYVYALGNIVADPKWVLVRQIGKGVVDETELKYWSVPAYDGKA